jgi:hypothetical protein
MQSINSDQHRQANEAFLNGLIEKFRADPLSISASDRLLVAKLVDSQQRAQMISSRIDQFKKQMELLTNQIRISESDLQQEVGKASGLVDALLLVSQDSPSKPPPPPPEPNRKARRAAAAKTRKGNGAGKPVPKSGAAPKETPAGETA